MVINSCKILIDDKGNQTGYEINGNTSITMDASNSDYQMVQDWIASGNTPEAADVPPAPTYQEQRAAEYPPIGDQLDSLFHAGVFPTDMASKIQAVKDKYPKVGA